MTSSSAHELMTDLREERKMVDTIDTIDTVASTRWTLGLVHLHHGKLLVDDKCHVITSWKTITRRQMPRHHIMENYY